MITIKEYMLSHMSEVKRCGFTPEQLLNLDLTKQSSQTLDELSYILYQISHDLDTYIENHNPITYFEVKCQVLTQFGGTNTDWKDFKKEDSNGTTYYFNNEKTNKSVLVRVEQNKIVTFEANLETISH